MRRVTAVLSAAAIVLWAASAFAQGKNFAGKWTPDAEKTAAAMAAAAGGAAGGGARAGGGGRMGGMGGGDINIVIDAKTLTIERTMGEAIQKTSYNLDGSPSKNMAGRAGQETEQTSKVKWEGDKLVITTTTANGDQVSSWYLDGASLVSERAPRQAGGAAQKAYYKKAS